MGEQRELMRELTMIRQPAFMIFVRNAEEEVLLTKKAVGNVMHAVIQNVRLDYPPSIFYRLIFYGNLYENRR